MRALDGIAEWPAQAAVVSFAGGGLKRFNTGFFSTLAGSYARFGNSALLWILPGLALGTPLTLLTNISLRRKLPSRHWLRHGSSVLIQIGPVESSPPSTSS